MLKWACMQPKQKYEGVSSSFGRSTKVGWWLIDSVGCNWVQNWSCSMSTRVKLVSNYLVWWWWLLYVVVFQNGREKRPREHSVSLAKMRRLNGDNRMSRSGGGRRMRGWSELVADGIPGGQRCTRWPIVEKEKVMLKGSGREKEWGERKAISGRKWTLLRKIPNI